MVCFHPIKAYYPISQRIDYHTGELKRDIKFTMPKFDYALDCAGGTLYFDYYEKLQKFELGSLEGQFRQKCLVPKNVPTYVDVNIPCGKCIGCHADRARNYATRAIHEYSYDRDQPSCFVTLTFNEDMLHKRDVSYYKSVSRAELSGFIKRLRERVYDKYKVTFRVFGSGEYGALKSRPHYHLLIYGFDFPDKYAWSYRTHSSSRDPIVYYRSEFLEKLWSPPNSDLSYGFSTIGQVTPSSCQYVSGYMADKLDEFSDKDYKQLGIDKPFLYTPSRPGLGHNYFLKYYEEIFNNGYCSLHNSIKAPIPAYYCDLLKRYYPDRFEVYKLDKLKFMIDNLFVENLELSEQRLRVREEALKMKYDKSVRSYEKMCFLHNI
ncbi:replication initiator protein [Sigmofec virus UA08Rod_5746]|uniref:Replication initiator protein n=1 Tax=Sigmofec virus UA08Rod_5746 TaxID=2929439 RepID=A0A976N195_9VIRU|nr:replication initiator protein [Sigmofec virus UA08Rod_5746]